MIDVRGHLQHDVIGQCSKAAMPRRSQTFAKRPTTDCVRTDLCATDHEIVADLPMTLERASVSSKRKEWREENGAAIAAYNGYIESHGTFSDDARSF